MNHTATYSPEDDKLRLYPACRLDADDYTEAKRLGFRWAPTQALFYAVWGPGRVAWLESQCGEIGDEDTTLEERAETRADRFDGYSANRAQDAESARQAVDVIANGIPLGQPILVGHHSEKRARKDAEKIESGMRRAVKMWETSEYWVGRAAGAMAHARYVNRPGVRARRIKKLEAERRKWIAGHTPHTPPYNGEPWSLGCECKSREERDECPRCKTQPMVLVGNKGRGAYPVRVSSLPAMQEHAAPWVAHLDLRIAYETALLGEQGAAGLLDKPKRPKQPPMLNYRAPAGIRVRQKWGSDIYTEKQHEMTKAEYAALYHESRWCVLSEDKSHRIRYFTRGGYGPNRESGIVFLTDSKTHGVPA